ncbi:MAG: DMT family transporter [Candidatus Levybacteria bacterium]|nr:DMT family transporter [Candidatus Levybacteria bacterium]
MNKGLLFAIISPLVSGIATILLGGASKLLHPLVILSLAPLIGGVLLALFLLSRGEKFKAKELKQNSKELFLLITVRQIIGWIPFVIALTFTDAIKAIFLTKVEPYFVLFWHWLIKKEPVKPRHIFLLVIHVSGAILLSTGGRFTLGKAQLGDLFIVASMATSSLSYIWATSLTRKIGAIKTNSFMLLIAGLIFLPFALLVSPASGWINLTGWAYLIGYTVLFSTIGLTLWFISLKSVRGWIVSALRALSPLLAAPFAYFLFGQTLSVVQILGGIVVLITSFLIAKEHLDSAKKTS